MRRATPAVLAALALAGAGCGGEDQSERLIPPADAAQLTDLLQRVEDARRAGNCIEARSLNQDAARAADELPERVDPELQRRIRRGISRIFELLGTQCSERGQDEEAAPTTTEAPVETEEPAPTTEAPAPTTEEPEPEPEPEPTTPTPTTPAPETPEDPADGTDEGTDGETGSADPGTGGAAAEDEG